jgi:hypothetical protein
VLALRLFEAAQLALEKTSGTAEAVAVDSQGKKGPGDDGKDLMAKVVVEKQQTQNTGSPKVAAKVCFDDSTDSVDEDFEDNQVNEDFEDNQDTGGTKAAAKKPIVCFDDDSVDEDYALSQDVLMIYELRDSLDSINLRK